MSPEESVQVVCGIILHGNRVLATRRGHGGRYPLIWEFPGGKVESGESPQNALVRELIEELNLAVCNLRSLDPVHYIDSDFSINLIPFACKPDQSEGPVPHDHVEIRWITALEALQLTWAPADIPLVDKLPELIKLYENE
jgi:8-oxo-dGTP diphosphatase